MLINTSYFQNKSVYIPSVVLQPSIGSNTPTAADSLQQEIDQREYEVLVKAFGVIQADTILDQLEQVDPSTEWTVKPSAAQKWKDLIDGVIYDGKKWNGLRYSVGTKKISLIAYYVYFWYLQSDWYSYTSTGIQVPLAENSERQLPNGQQSKAWNEFLRMYGGNFHNHRNYSFFHNWNGMGIRWAFGNNEQSEVSLYRFLNDRSGDYDLTHFQHMGMVNVYNL